jgi:hypothetical protein
MTNLYNLRGSKQDTPCFYSHYGGYFEEMARRLQDRQA